MTYSISMISLKFTPALDNNIWFVTGGLPDGIDGTIAVSEDMGYLKAVGKVKNGTNVPLTLKDESILKSSYIKIDSQPKKLLIMMNLDDSSDPLDLPMIFKISKSDRLTQLIIADDVTYIISK